MELCEWRSRRTQQQQKIEWKCWLFYFLFCYLLRHRSVFACGLCGVPGSSLERERKRIFLYGYDDVELDLAWEVISECHLEK